MDGLHKIWKNRLRAYRRVFVHKKNRHQKHRRIGNAEKEQSVVQERW